MNELLDTERVYVEELLCVLEVSLPLVDGRACAVGWDSSPGWSCVHHRACERRFTAALLITAPKLKQLKGLSVGHGTSRLRWICTETIFIARKGAATAQTKHNPREHLRSRDSDQRACVPFQ